MSDVSQGPGGWLATDGKWYPPERHPSYQAPQVAHSEPAAQPPQVELPALQQPQVVSPQQALEAKSFIRSLYDLSFSSLITLRVI